MFPLYYLQLLLWDASLPLIHWVLGGKLSLPPSVKYGDEYQWMKWPSNEQEENRKEYFAALFKKAQPKKTKMTLIKHYWQAKKLSLN